MSHQKLLLVEQETILLYNQAEPAARSIPMTPS